MTRATQQRPSSRTPRCDRSHPLAVVPGVAAAFLAAIAIWLVMHNPTIDNTSFGEYSCSAPYDTVLNDADNVPGGEPAPDGGQISARCRRSGQARFTQGAVAGAAAAALAATAVLLARPGRPHD
jgi:hypothetical protein